MPSGSPDGNGHRIKTVERGAASSVLLAASFLDGVGGRFFVDRNESDVADRRTGTLRGVARYAVDPDGAGRLWDLSRQRLTQAR
ncbi:hypothetical protein ACWDCC_13390 [Streptomyces sp. NPDC001102]